MKRYEALSGRKVKELVSQIRVDPTTQLVFRELGHNLAEFLLPHLVSHQLDTLVTGGNITLAWELIMDELLQSVKEKSLPVKIVKS